MNPSHDLQGLKKKAKETFLYALSALFLGIAIGAIDAVFGPVSYTHLTLPTILLV